MLEEEIAKLMIMISENDRLANLATQGDTTSRVIKGGAFDALDEDSPFNIGLCACL